jgi:hypothetical protein
VTAIFDFENGASRRTENFKPRMTPMDFRFRDFEIVDWVNRASRTTKSFEPQMTQMNADKKNAAKRFIVWRVDLVNQQGSSICVICAICGSSS